MSYDWCELLGLREIIAYRIAFYVKKRTLARNGKRKTADIGQCKTCSQSAHKVMASKFAKTKLPSPARGSERERGHIGFTTVGYTRT